MKRKLTKAEKTIEASLKRGEWVSDNDVVLARAIVKAARNGRKARKKAASSKRT